MRSQTFLDVTIQAVWEFCASGLLLVSLPSSRYYETMQDGSIQLFVKTQSHIQIVTWILEAANYDLEKIKISAIRNKKNLKDYLNALPSDIATSCGVLVDFNAGSVPDALAGAKRQLGNPPVEVFCAVPEIEAWLFADERKALENVKTQWGLEILPTLPLPEDIKTPKIHAEEAFGKTISSWGFVNNIDIDRASARSPSLRNFLTRLNRMLAAQPTSPLRSISRSISRDVFAGLISEVVPADTVIWRTASGDSFKAVELRREIEEGTDVGQQYASDVLRVARDFLKRRANRRESE